MKLKYKVVLYALWAVIVLSFLILRYLSPGLKAFTSPLFIRDYLLGFGSWSYLVFIGLLLLAIPLPLPSLPLVLGGGYVYGTVLGSFLALVAVIIGGTIGFFLVRKFGRPLLERVVSPEQIEHFNHLFNRKGKIAVFISYAVPLFPSDALTLVLGLTNLKFRTFLLLLVLGHIPRYLIINSFGEDLLAGFNLKTILALLLGILIILLIFFLRRKLKKIHDAYLG